MVPVYPSLLRRALRMVPVRPSRDDGRMTPSDTPLDPDVVRWSAPPAERDGRPLLVLLHGYGSDENDLFGLAPSFPPSSSMASVRAPLAPPWPMMGNAWYAMAAAFAPRWDSFTLRTAAGQVQTLTAGNAFSNPAR